jgi:hypothetical protein
VGCYQEITGTYGFAASLKLSLNAALFGVGGHIQRQNMQPFNDRLYLTLQFSRPTLGASVAQFGGCDDTDAHVVAADLGYLPENLA